MRTMILIASTIMSLSTFARDIATIGPSSFVGSSGAIAVNLAAGNLNTQSSNLVHSEQISYQVSIVTSPTLSIDGGAASASVKGDAFSNAGGYISANIIAGNGNQQHNTVIFGDVVDLDWQAVELSSQRALDVEPTQSSMNVTVELSPQALSSASGVVQMSQIAGTGNAARNTFQMPTTIN